MGANRARNADKIKKARDRCFESRLLHAQRLTERIEHKSSE